MTVPSAATAQIIANMPSPASKKKPARISSIRTFIPSPPSSRFGVNHALDRINRMIEVQKDHYKIGGLIEREGGLNNGRAEAGL